MQNWAEQIVTTSIADGIASNSAVESLPDSSTLEALYALNGISGFGPAKFRILHESGIHPCDALEDPNHLPFTGRTGEKLKLAIYQISSEQRKGARDLASIQLKAAESFSASILTYNHPDYPEHVYQSNNPIPILFVRGDTSIWRDRPSVAVVGSREIREPYATATMTLATTASNVGFLVVSGFATGADTIGHRAARDAGGFTVCVMPCGLDHVFPPENRELWKELLDYPNSAFVSEFGFGQRTSSLQLRKRNKLIVAYSQGVFVAQSSESGGAMNAYRHGREHRKPVGTFTTDGTTDTAGNASIQENLRTGGVAIDLPATPSDCRRWLGELPA